MARHVVLDWITTSPIAYPALEVVHITDIALLVGNLVLVELRVWGLGRTLPCSSGEDRKFKHPFFSQSPPAMLLNTH